jgi:hypothetical protein
MRGILIAVQAGYVLLGAPLAVFAGVVPDFDFDLVPSDFDGCSQVANGPSQTSNQVDSDLDGYGNRCDTDYDQNGATTAADFGLLLGCFGQIGPFGGSAVGCRVIGHDGNTAITAADFGIFLGKFSGAGDANRPGPSGLFCANPTIRVDLGQVPCTP